MPPGGQSCAEQREQGSGRQRRRRRTRQRRATRQSSEEELKRQERDSERRGEGGKSVVTPVGRPIGGGARSTSGADHRPTGGGVPTDWVGGGGGVGFRLGLEGSVHSAHAEGVRSEARVAPCLSRGNVIGKLLRDRASLSTAPSSRPSSSPGLSVERSIKPASFWPLRRSCCHAGLDVRCERRA